MQWYGIIAAAVLVVFDLIFFRDSNAMFLFLIGLGVGLAALPFIVSLSLENKREEKINEMFLEFSRNLAESVSTGTPISKGIINMKNKNYGVLNQYIKKLSNQIELGIPVERAFRTFADDTGSVMIQRATSLISEAEKAGGEIEQILDSTAKSISEIEKLKKERKSAIYSLMVQGYIIFFIFIGIILVMQFRIIPLTVGVGGFSSIYQGGANIQNSDANVKQAAPAFSVDDLTQPFLYLLLSQGFFAGLVIGKLTEGSVKKGLKHSFILMISAFLISTGAKLFATVPK